MTIDISIGTIGAACTVATLAGKIVHGLFSNALERRDEKIKELESALKAAREVDASTRKILFDKLDVQHNALQDYKLYAAEHYVGTEKLKDIIAPVLTRLDSIERDLRNGGGVSA